MDIPTATLTVKYIIISRCKVLSKQLEVLEKMTATEFFSFGFERAKIMAEWRELEDQLRILGDGGTLNYHKKAPEK